jgi:hypothetical protein
VVGAAEEIDVALVVAEADRQALLQRLLDVGPAVVGQDELDRLLALEVDLGAGIARHLADDLARIGIEAADDVAADLGGLARCRTNG